METNQSQIPCLASTNLANKLDFDSDSEKWEALFNSSISHLITSLKESSPAAVSLVTIAVKQTNKQTTSPCVRSQCLHQNHRPEAADLVVGATRWRSRTGNFWTVILQWPPLGPLRAGQPASQCSQERSEGPLADLWSGILARTTNDPKLYTCG